MRSQTYYLDVTPPGFDKGTFVQAIAKRLGISTDAVATIGDMQNDLAMFHNSGISFAMGNATDDVKQQATHVTKSNEEDGFAAAIEVILKGTRRNPRRLTQARAGTHTPRPLVAENVDHFVSIDDTTRVGDPAFAVRRFTSPSASQAC